jgi:hypothetical protein
MKPRPPISSSQSAQRNFPLTDYQFHATAELTDPSTAVAQKTHTARELRTFRKLSNEFFATETQSDYVKEFLLFSLIGAISAWPIISTLIAVTRFVRNY